MLARPRPRQPSHRCCAVIGSARAKGRPLALVAGREVPWSLAASPSCHDRCIPRLLSAVPTTASTTSSLHSGAHAWSGDRGYPLRPTSCPPRLLRAAGAAGRPVHYRHPPLLPSTRALCPPPQHLAPAVPPRSWRLPSRGKRLSTWICRGVSIGQAGGSHNSNNNNDNNSNNSNSNSNNSDLVDSTSRTIHHDSQR